MLSRYTDKNKYGGYTWHIKLDSLFHIFVNGTKDNSYVVDFKEWKWVSYKTHFSFVSQDSLANTIAEAYNRVFDFFQDHKKYNWTEQQKNNKLSQTLDLLKKEQGPISDSHSNIQTTSIELRRIKIIRGVGIDDNLIDLTTSQMIYEKYGDPHDTVNHNNFSLELKYPQFGMSFFYKIADPIKIIYLMMATGEVPGETETGLILDRELTLQQVLSDYGVVDPQGTEQSDEGYMIYPGIMFYAKKNDLTDLQANEIHIHKIAVLDINK